MEPQRWQRVKRLLLDALEQREEQRAAFLDRECDGDGDLRRRVDSLLACDVEARDFLELPPLESKRQEMRRATPAEDGRIGPYRVLRLLGRGGMGAVYLAVRSDDEYENRVAVKVLERGHRSGGRRRFRGEGHILASLEHPNIAKLLDGGTTERGLAFLVMEYVRGEPVDRYCERHRLDTRRRLALFRRVCAAVHFAHQNLVVHRDLKPSNILVSADGTPKLLDFGIAKLLSPPLHQVPATAADMRPMTPDYAAPEQVRGEAITTATDVYALGVVLYELLTRRRPYRLGSGNLEEVLRAICDQEPERPSVAVQRRQPSLPVSDSCTVAPVRDRRDARQLARQLAGDLDSILLKALRKEPQARYASAEQLAEDLQRHLDGTTVRARKWTLAYRTGKFVRRHAVAVAMAASLVLLILAFGVVSSLQQRRIVRERDRAERVAEFLVELFGAADPHRDRGELLGSRALLDWGTRRIRTELTDRPRLAADLMHSIGRAYLNLGLYDDAEPLLRDAVALERQVLGEEHPEVATILDSLGSLHLARGELDQAEALHREGLALRRRRLGKLHPDVARSLDGLAGALTYQGKYQSAEPLLRRAVEIERRARPRNDPALANSLHNLASLLTYRGRYQESESCSHEALQIFRRHYGRVHPSVAGAAHQLGRGLQMQGRYREAEPYLRESLDLQRQLFGDVHSEVAGSLHSLALLLRQTGRYDAAEDLYREALDVLRATVGEEHRNVAMATHNLARLLHEKGDLAAAEPLYHQALALQRKLHGTTHPDVAAGLGSLAGLRGDQDDYRAAEELHREALELRRQIFGPEHHHVAASLNNLGHVLELAGDPESAEAHYREALVMLRKLLGEEHPELAAPLTNLARVLADGRGEPAAAESYVREALALRRRSLGEDHPQLATSLGILASVREARGDCAGAETAAREALRILERASSASPRTTDRVRLVLGRCLTGPEGLAEAESQPGELAQ